MFGFCLGLEVAKMQSTLRMGLIKAPVVQVIISIGKHKCKKLSCFCSYNQWMFTQTDTPRELFFPKVPNFWAWADKLGKKCRDILCKPQCPSWHLILYWLYIIWRIAFTCPSLVEIKSNLMSLKPWEQHNCPRDILKFHILSLSPTKIFT